MPDHTPSPEELPAEAVEVVAKRRAIKELWGYWADIDTPQGKARAEKRWDQLPEAVKNSWRKYTRLDLEAVLPIIQQAERERVLAEAVERVEAVFVRRDMDRSPDMESWWSGWDTAYKDCLAAIQSTDEEKS